MSRGKEVLVGAVILLALATGVMGTLWMQGTNWGRPSVPVHVLLRDVAQLGPGNPVKFRGVQIGRVATVAVEEDGQAVRVLLEIESEVGLPTDGVVLIAPESFFGSWQAEITTRSRYPRFDFFSVPPGEQRGDTLVLGGYALPELSRLTASAEQISENLADLSERLEIAFNDQTAQSLAQAINNMEVISEQIRALVDQQGEIAASVTSRADSALAEIAEASEVARRSFERVETLLGDQQVDSILSSIRSATRSIEVIATDLSGSSGELAQTLKRADSTFARINRLSARVEAGEGAIGRLFADSTLAVRVEDVLQQLDLLLRDLRENPRRYVRLSIF